MAYVVDKEKANSGTMNTVYSVCRFVQLFSFIYSFISFFYWFLNCVDIPIAPFLRFLFELPYGFVRLFGYIPQGTSADFTGAIVGAFFLCLGFFSNFIADSIDQILVSNTRNQSYKKREYANVNVPQAHIAPGEIETIELVKKKFIFLLDIKIASVDIAANSNQTVDSDKLRKRICDAIIDNLNMNKLEQCGFYKKNLFIVYKEFDYVDNFIYYIKATLDSLAKEFATPQIMIDFNVSFSVIANLQQLETELLLMDTILNLNMLNEFITTSKFKSMYENRERTKYVLVSKGAYNLSRNLSVSNNQDIFTIKEKHL